MEKFEGVANTLFVPLVARIAVSKQFISARGSKLPMTD